MISSVQKSTFRNLFLFLLACSLLTSCKDNGLESDNESRIETYTVTDIPADVDAEPGDEPQFTFYNLENRMIVADADSASDKWDLAFSQTTILINSGVSGPGNGGVVILDLPFESVTIAPETGYLTDSSEGNAISGWYNYTGQNEPQHAILPHENMTFVVRTGDGEHNAKIRILSYYQGNPDPSSEEFAAFQTTRPPSRYYTIEYAIQLNGSRELN